MIEVDLMRILRESPAVVAVVDGRVYDEEVPAKSPVPYVVFRTIVGRRENTLVVPASKLRNARIQVDCYASTKVAAASVGKVVMAAIVSATVFSATANEDGLFKDPETGRGRHALDFSIWQRETE